MSDSKQATDSIVQRILYEKILKEVTANIYCCMPGVDQAVNIEVDKYVQDDIRDKFDPIWEQVTRNLYSDTYGEVWKEVLFRKK